MLRESLVSTIGRATSPDVDLVEAWERAAHDPATLSRVGIPSHFTASALPMTPDGRRVCLVLHRLIQRWVQPGGHLEPDDQSIPAAAARELREETGMTADIDPVPLLLSRHPAPCGVGEWHLDVQMLAVTDERAPVVSAESEDVAWFDVDRLPTEVATGVAQLVAEGEARLSRSAHRGAWSPGR